MNYGFSFRRLLPVIAVGALLATSCVGDKKDGGDSAVGEETEVGHAIKVGALTVDSVHWVDSLEFGGCHAHVSIDGCYPTGGQQFLADSIRAWVAQRLSDGCSIDCKSAEMGDVAALSDGSALVAAVGKARLHSARADFEGFARDAESAEIDLAVGYEHVYSFLPVFHSDSLITYNFSGYDYLGGAHGSSVQVGQTFVVGTGEKLDAENMFLPESAARLSQLIREELWKQYFAPFRSDDPNASLADELLVAPELLSLPVSAPVCVEEGVMFVYQQYEIACYAAGMPQCVLPYDVVKPLMRPQVARLMP